MIPVSCDRRPGARPGGLMTLALLVLAAGVGCGGSRPSRGGKLERTIDPATKLTVIKWDSKGAGTFDTWSYLDGPRFVRIETDRDGDGQVDKWEYYDEQNKVTRIRLIGVQGHTDEATKYLNPDGSTNRIEMASQQGGRIDRIEHYEGGKKIRVEVDGDQDGAMDKWETWRDDRLVMEAFDTAHRGAPDRRILYGPNGEARLQVDPAGDGRFVDAPAGDQPPRPGRRGR